MRPPVPRLTAALAILIAVLTAVGQAAPRNGRDRDRVARTTRAGALRLDAPEGAFHLHDDEVLLQPVDELGPERAASRPTPPTPPAALGPAPRPMAPPCEPGTRVTSPHEPGRRLAARDPHAPDRAPPA